MYTRDSSLRDPRLTFHSQVDGEMWASFGNGHMELRTVSHNPPVENVGVSHYSYGMSHQRANSAYLEDRHAENLITLNRSSSVSWYSTTTPSGRRWTKRTCVCTFPTCRCISFVVKGQQLAVGIAACTYRPSLHDTFAGVRIGVRISYTPLANAVDVQKLSTQKPMAAKLLEKTRHSLFRE